MHSKSYREGMHDYTIDEAAERTGLTKHTLRYYEREGLLPPIAKASSGHRRYSEGDIGWVKFLQLLKNNRTIKKIKKFLK